jgi:hypothetical protein
MRTLALDDRERAVAVRLLADFLDGYERAIPAPRIMPAHEATARLLHARATQRASANETGLPAGMVIGRR